MNRFPISFGAFKPLLLAVGLWPSASHVEIDATEVKARMGWAFRATFPRSSVVAVENYTGIPGGIGVHGFRGKWLVNGSASGIVSIDIEPVGRAYVMGIPVKLRRLSVSLEEPQRLIAELAR